jgi:hypothetical protein
MSNVKLRKLSVRIIDNATIESYNSEYKHRIKKDTHGTLPRRYHRFPQHDG